MRRRTENELGVQLRIDVRRTPRTQRYRLVLDELCRSRPPRNDHRSSLLFWYLSSLASELTHSSWGVYIIKLVVLCHSILWLRVFWNWTDHSVSSISFLNPKGLGKSYLPIHQGDWTYNMEVLSSNKKQNIEMFFVGFVAFTTNYLRMTNGMHQVLWLDEYTGKGTNLSVSYLEWGRMFPSSGLHTSFL